jgi:hypothetical protein
MSATRIGRSGKVDFVFVSCLLGRFLAEWCFGVCLGRPRWARLQVTADGLVDVPIATVNVIFKVMCKQCAR